MAANAGFLLEPNRCYQVTYSDGTTCRIRFGDSVHGAWMNVEGTDLDTGDVVRPFAYHYAHTEILEIPCP